MSDPGAGLEPIKTAALDNVNRTYIGVPARLASQFASRGYGSSGEFGNSLYKTELARAGDVSKLEGEFGKAAIDQKNYGAQLATAILNAGRGHTTTTTGPDTSLGDAFMSGGNALSNIARLFTLHDILKKD
jgi:hypothetical protein